MAVQQLRLLKFAKCILQRGLIARGYSSNQRIRKVTADDGADLRDLLDRVQAVEPRHQRIVKCLRDGQRRKWPVKPIARGLFHQNAGFENSLGELLDKQRISIGLRYNLFHHFCR